jgi:excisionase family DNA binding protein
MEILTACETATFTRLPLPYVRLLTARKEIPHIRVGRRVLYRAVDIERWLDGLTTTGRGDEKRRHENGGHNKHSPHDTTSGSDQQT